MEELIQRLSTYVDDQDDVKSKSEIQDKPNSLNAKSDAQYNPSSRVAGQSELHKAIDDVYSEVNKIANCSFEIPSSNNKKEQVPLNIVKDASSKNGTIRSMINHTLDIKKKKQEFSRNNMIYRPWWDKNANTYGKNNGYSLSNRLQPEHNCQVIEREFRDRQQAIRHTAHVWQATWSEQVPLSTRSNQIQ